MTKPYSKADSTRHAAKEIKEKAKPKPIPKMSEKKKAELENRKTWTAAQFKKASKEVKKDNKKAFLFRKGHFCLCLVIKIYFQIKNLVL